MRFHLNNAFLTVIILSVFAISCSSKKEAKKLYLMKNLTAHYNIYFNAKEQLNEVEAALQKSYEEDYSQLLPIYPIPTEESSSGQISNLNQVIERANIIALEKYQSNWLDDAYLLLAQAEYVKSDFYNALEYNSYVSTVFPKEKKNKMGAYIGEIKAQIALNNLNAADSLHSLAKSLDHKYFKDEVFALGALLNLKRNSKEEAISQLQKAINATNSTTKKLRWRYILAQLQEQTGDIQSALSNYSKVTKSNAAFEMSFNANLATIRITENGEGKDFDKIATLQKLLKEDKNKEFKEQIYYQIAMAHYANKDFQKAIENLQISAHSVPSTSKQKGLSFLKIAELSFEDLQNYEQAKLYYDSTLQYLPKTYPYYNSITLKANNLQYITERLQIIDQENKQLQLANFSSAELDAEFDLFFENKKKVIKSQKTKAEELSPFDNIDAPALKNKTEGNFYFYNAGAISQGLSAFKNRWGNRKLTDNWRTSNNLPVSSLTASQNPSADLGSSALDLARLENQRDSIKKDFIDKIPYNPAAKEMATTKIVNALQEIAIFYRDVLKDSLKAVSSFELLLNNYPNYVDVPNVTYLLYRLTSNSDLEKSNSFKKQLIDNYPNSLYTQTIINPNFGKEELILERQLSENYNILFKTYESGNYSKVLEGLQTLKSNYQSFGKFGPQYAYLEALAIGNLQKTPIFLASLNSITAKYPDDTIVTPIVKQQIDYITKNRAIFDQRPTALLRYDSKEVLFNDNEMLILPKAEEKKPAASVAIEKKEVVNNVPLEESKQVPVAVKKSEETPILPNAIENIEVKKPAEPEKINFKKVGEDKYLIVIDFQSEKQNISPVFSQLSQFLYKKYGTENMKLYIRTVGNTDKFIIISNNFYSDTEANVVLEEILNREPKILNPSSAQYINFVISDVNLALLRNRDAINQYIKFSSEKK